MNWHAHARRAHLTDIGVLQMGVPQREFNSMRAAARRPH